uniref:Reverse transcriptase/retrotransposon-derived protein RNase H-like domain-containing protein n=1 Tax=Anguilla anguilla TaxID=7936 RepID=A0A0E9WP86_ANGAN
MVGYDHSFCRKSSAVTSPLLDILSTKTAFCWTEKCQQSFENIKTLLVSILLSLHSHLYLP